MIYFLLTYLVHAWQPTEHSSGAYDQFRVTFRSTTAINILMWFY